ncbi:MAG: transketolase [Chitinophagaceae bacterium]|jgi:pyruvate/2-oxoglutarate/acetoin dehydrogenase E1 component/TPP-dependent pyruvate/acetoin dehydrogenase alpha subunit|nr:transketolase [Chitinophagaceae bacterium]
MENIIDSEQEDVMLSFEDFRDSVLLDYKVMVESREMSLLGRREVLTGKAKFGVFGDGKETVQVAAARFFQPGDFRSGYYRDQTFMLAAGITNVQQIFSQLYADTDPNYEPFSSGRNMVGHFATPNVDKDGNWLNLTNIKNTVGDIAPTAAQMPRSLGLAFASKLFRNSAVLQNEQFAKLSQNGNEICFCSIGDAATSEGHFWEIINAAGVSQVPLAVFVWDDGYGISVPTNKQTTKGSISEALQGLQKQEDTNGIDIYQVKGWDYAGMCEVFEQAIEKIRKTHIPAVFHVQELTQPLGHSTSGSHERYKSAERLQWEREWDCLKKMKEWIVENGIATSEELDNIRAGIKQSVRESRNKAWECYINPIMEECKQAAELLKNVVTNNIDNFNKINKLAAFLVNAKEPLRKDILNAIAQVMALAPDSPSYSELADFYKQYKNKWSLTYDRFLYNETEKSALKVPVIPAEYPLQPTLVNGYEILNKYFDTLFKNNPSVVAFGEDVGRIGDVNQGFAGLQEKHGENRIFDTGIRELSIIGKGIGLAYRGLRPIAEVQYLDYLLYALEPLSDDVVTMHYRTGGIQSCPLIVRTRGHRLEGIFHSGSPMGMLINTLRGMYICVPRNMVQAAGMYNTLLHGNDPGLIIESLNGYRLKENLPSNLLEFTVPVGVPEILKEGDDVTIVSYGSMLRIVQDAAARLAAQGIACEVIDIQTLLPFDTNHIIVQSLKKTNRIVFVDEDVPNGAAAYMYNKVLEEQNGYRWLDAAARTITGKAHRPAYGSDGDYFSKPNAEDIIETVMKMMRE